MFETTLEVVVIGIATWLLLSLAGFVAGFLWFHVRRLFTPYRKKPTMTTYTFKLYRRVRTRSGAVIISAFDLQIECADPFLKRMYLSEQYPGWAISPDFSSTTDEEFDEIFGDESFDFFNEPGESA